MSSNNVTEIEATLRDNIRVTVIVSIIVLILAIIITYQVASCDTEKAKLTGYQMATAGQLNSSFVTSGGDAQPFIYGV